MSLGNRRGSLHVVPARIQQEGARMQCVLAATHHDPDQRLAPIVARLLPTLQTIYTGIAVTTTSQTPTEAVADLHTDNVVLATGSQDLPIGHLHLGLWRRKALETAYRAYPQAQYFHFCDLDRVLHWVDYYPEELRQVLATAHSYDFVVLGRTARAFASHPRVQCETEALANRTFALVNGDSWDIAAAARCLSPRAAQLIIERCDDDTVGSDCSWPLLARRAPDLSVGYIETEGLEFETLDRYADEIAALGGRQEWIDRMDADPHQWLARTDLTRAHMASAIAYGSVSAKSAA
jgi:hypothetical protein